MRSFPSKLTIREANGNDIGEIYSNSHDFDWEPFRSDISSFIPKTFVATQGKKVLGFVQVMLLGNEKGEIVTLGIRNGLSKRSIGSSLLGKAHAHLKQRGVKQVYLASSKRGAGFYEKAKYRRLLQHEMKGEHKDHSHTWSFPVKSNKRRLK